MSDKLSYAMGWVLQATPNGEIVWHNGGTGGYRTFIGFDPDARAGQVLEVRPHDGVMTGVVVWVIGSP